MDHCITKNVPNTYLNVSLELLLNKLYNHPVYNLFSMEEVVNSFNDLLSELKCKKKKCEYLDCDISNETDINILKNLKNNKDLLYVNRTRGEV